MIKFKGDRIYCDNRHFVCEVAEDIPRFSVMMAKFFTNWQIPEPAAGELIPPCHCGASFNRSLWTPTKETEA